MDARLEKVRQRKQLKQPAVTEEKEEEVAEEEKREEVVVDPLAAMIESELGRAREKAEKGERGSEEQDGGRAKKPYVRPWDKGKGEQIERKNILNLFSIFCFFFL